MDKNFADVSAQNDEEEQETLETPEPEVGLPADQPEVEPKDDAVEEVDALKQRNQELYEQLRKAKGFIRDDKTGKWVKKEPAKLTVQPDTTSADITIMELKSLLAANIHDDSDTEEVRLWARSHKTSITEALKVPEVKSMLKTRIEMRKVAEATNTSSSRFGSAKTTPTELLEKARKGEVPKDMDGIEALAKARVAEMKEKAGIK